MTDELTDDPEGSAGALEPRPDDLVLVDLGDGTALVIGDHEQTGLTVEPLLFPISAGGGLGDAVATSTGWVNTGLQLADGYSRAQGLVRLSPDTLQALKSAQPLTKDGWNLGTLVKDGKFAKQVRWAPAGGAGAVGVLAAIGPAAALVAIQYQLGKISAAVERNIVLTTEVLERLREQQWAELHGVRKVVLEALEEARHIGVVSDAVWTNVEGRQADLEAHKKLFADAGRRHLRQVGGLKGLDERREWFGRHAAAVLMDAASLVAAQESWFVYQGLRAGHLATTAGVDDRDRRHLELLVSRTRSEHERISSEITSMLDQLERCFGEIEEFPGKKRMFSFGKDKHSAAEIRRMSQELRGHLATVRGDTFPREPAVPAPPAVTALAKPDAEAEIRRRIRWVLAAGESVGAIADARLCKNRMDSDPAYEVLTDRRLLVISTKIESGVKVLREIDRADIRFVRVIEGADARLDAIEMRIAATNEELVLAFPDWAKPDDKRSTARTFAQALCAAMSLPSAEIPVDPTRPVGHEPALDAAI